jgi:hypothetical protein
MRQRASCLALRPVVRMGQHEEVFERRIQPGGQGRDGPGVTLRKLGL